MCHFFDKKVEKWVCLLYLLAEWKLSEDLDMRGAMRQKDLELLNGDYLTRNTFIGVQLECAGMLSH